MSRRITDQVLEPLELQLFPNIARLAELSRRLDELPIEEAEKAKEIGDARRVALEQRDDEVIESLARHQKEERRHGVVLGDRKRLRLDVDALDQLPHRVD